MWFFILSGLIACTGQSASSSCPVEMTPSAGVVRFGDPFSANCSSLSNQTEGMGWESSLGGTSLKDRATFVPLNIESATNWNIHAQCFINLLDGHQCTEFLPITVYKTPDSVSISQLGPIGPLEQGRTLIMQCDIVNVAPVRNLSVHWHQGNKIIKTETFDDADTSPVNKSSLLTLIADRYDNGTQIWCEAKLDFWPSLPNLPTSQSKSHDITVLYPPTCNDPANETLEIPAGSEMILNCTATGNPSPAYGWHSPPHVQQTNKNQNEDQPILTLSFTLPGIYKCTASNTQGTTTKYFTVIEAKRNRTTFAALVGVFVSLGALLFVSGLFFVTPEGTFAFSKGSYLKGRPTSSGPV